jgi:hypothetical protein
MSIPVERLMADLLVYGGPRKSGDLEDRRGRRSGLTTGPACFVLAHLSVNIAPAPRRNDEADMRGPELDRSSAAQVIGETCDLTPEVGKKVAGDVVGGT